MCIPVFALNSGQTSLTSPSQESESEAPRGQQGHGRRLLGYDRRVVADGRGGHVGHQRDPFGGLRRRPEHGPGVGRMALGREPGMVVIRDDGEGEPSVLGADDVRHQVGRRALLAHHGVANANHVTTPLRVPTFRPPLAD